MVFRQFLPSDFVESGYNTCFYYHQAITHAVFSA